MPTLAGVTPKTPVGSVKRRSQQAAISTPPPMQWPRIIAIVGLGKSRRAAWAARLSRRTTAMGSAGSGPLSRSAMSAPAQKLGPAPVTTSTRTAESSASAARTPGSPAHMAAVMALRLSGRSIVSRATCPSRETVSGRATSVISAEVVGGEGVALVRVTALVAGQEPLLPLLRRAVRERVLVDPAVAEVRLDEVVTDPRGGVQGPVDVVLGDLGDERLPRRVRHRRRVVGPGAGVAVGLQLQPHGAAGRAGLAGGHLLVGAEQVLHVVPVLVGEHVGVDEGSALRAELRLQLVEEA